MDNDGSKLPEVLIVGCGDIGMRIARLVQQAGGQACGMARSADSAARLRTAGIAPVIGDLDDVATLAGLPGSPHRRGRR